MKVLLIDPAGAQRYVTHNAGLAYLSSALLARQHEVRVLDMNNYDFSWLSGALVAGGTYYLTARRVVVRSPRLGLESQ